jgi:tRNA(adenine34) deaminase
LTLNLFSDEYFMGEALKEAVKALEKDEIPIGAIVVSNNKIIARGHNLTEQLNDVTAHAEMIAITSAGNHYQSKYLPECAIYITLEPCAMCAAAIGWAQIKNIVFGAFDPKKGFTSFKPSLVHPKTLIKGGILEQECSDLLKAFFKEKR